MSVIIVFMAVVGAVALWWLAQQRLMAKPWLEVGELGEFPGAGPSAIPTAKIGLGVFLAVVGSLFALIVSAYLMRRAAFDWNSPPVPPLLWVNTGLLIMSSIALHWAQVSARRDDLDGVRGGLLAGGVSALAFLAGQLVAWKQLADAGYFLASNPANAFFFLITAMHGLHMLGGLVALGRTAAKAWRSYRADELRLSVELCAMYWHFLLFVWLLLFSLLMRWVDDFIDICRQLLT